MKKIAAIALLALLLFNWCGYRQLISFLQTRAETKLEATIDDGNYNTAHLIELSVVTNLPYTNDWIDWERCTGSVEVNGMHYQYVERKMEKGSMLYRCLPNVEKQNLVTARDEFFQLVNNFNQQTDNKKSSPSIVINNYIGDYDDAVVYYSFKPTTFSPSNVYLHWISPISEIQRLTPHQPPDC